jgi:hypothetical protein
MSANSSSVQEAAFRGNLRVQGVAKARSLETGTTPAS